MRITTFLIAIWTALACGPASAADDVVLWHALVGEARGRFERVVAAWNYGRADGKIVTAAQRSSADLVAGAIAARRRGAVPLLVVATDQGLPFLAAAPGGIRPLHRLLAEARVELRDHDPVKGPRGAFTDAEGRLVGLPITVQAPVMYYDRGAFAMAGLDPDKPPRTWPELESAARAIVNAKAATCGFTSQWLSWIHVEGTAASHGGDIVTVAEEGGAKRPRLSYASPLVVRHLTMLREWQAEKLFEYGGPRSRADRLFREGRCAIMFAPSVLAGSIARGRSTPPDVAPLPYWPDVAGAPTRLFASGGAVVALGGGTAEQYRHAARFLAHLATPDVQAKLTDDTGYIPLSPAGLARLGGTSPATRASRAAYAGAAGEGRGRGVGPAPYGSLEIVRDVLEDALEQVFTGKAFVKDALEAAERRGNALLDDFAAATEPKP